MRPAKPNKTGWTSTDAKSLPDTQVGKHRAKKDTKRWCKGVAGREHVWVYTLFTKWFWAKDEYFWKCSVCRKEDWSRDWQGQKKI